MESDQHYGESNPNYYNSNRTEGNAFSSDPSFCNNPSYSSTSDVAAVVSIGGEERQCQKRHNSYTISKNVDYRTSEMQQINEEGFSLNCQLTNLSNQKRDDLHQDYHHSGAYSYDRRYAAPSNEYNRNQKKRKTGPSDDEHSQERYQHDLCKHRSFISSDTEWMQIDMNQPSAFTVPHKRHDYDPRQSYHHRGAYIYDRRYAGPNEYDGNQRKWKANPSDDEHSQGYHQDLLQTQSPFIISGDSRNSDISLPPAFAVPHKRHGYHHYSTNQSGYYYHSGPSSYSRGDYRSRSPHPDVMVPPVQLPPSKEQRSMIGLQSRRHYTPCYENVDLNSNHHPSELWSLAEPAQEMYKTKSKNKIPAQSVDKPRRPLTAYNFFFSEERELIIAQLPDEEPENDYLNREVEKENSDSKSLPLILSKMRTLTVEEKDKIREVARQKTQNMLTKIHMESQRPKKTHAKVHGKIAFQQLAKIVGQRWRNLDKVQKDYYDHVAAKDSNRYKEQMATFGQSS